MLATTDSDGDCASYCTLPPQPSKKQPITPDKLRQQLVGLLPKLLVHASRLTRSRLIADDLVQTTCERALDRLDQWQGGGRFESWVVRIMESIWFNELRKKRQRQEQEIEDPDLVPSAGFEGAANAKFMLSKLQECGLVSSEDFSLIMKIHLYGYTYRELAEECDMPIGTLLSRVSRSMKTLRQAMLQLEHFPIKRNQPSPPPNHPQDGTISGGWVGERAGYDFIRSENALAQEAAA